MKTEYDVIAELSKPHKPENVRELIRTNAPMLTCSQLGVALGDPYKPIPNGKATERLIFSITDGRLYTADPKVTRRDCLLARVNRPAFAQWLTAFGTPADRQSEASFWAAQKPDTKAAAVAPVRAAAQPPSANPATQPNPAPDRRNLLAPMRLSGSVAWE